MFCIADYVRKKKSIEQAELKIFSPDEVRALQLEMLDIYKDVMKVCEDNGFHLMMGGGSALGALRHHGFIPWDDDMDLMLPRAECRPFVEIFQSAFPDKYDIASPFNITEYIALGIQIIKKESVLISLFNCEKIRPAGIAIDIFALDYVPDGYLAYLTHGIVSNVMLYILHSMEMYLCKNKYSDRFFANGIKSRVFYYFRLTIGCLFSPITYKAMSVALDKWISRYDATSRISIPSGRKHYFGETHPKAVFYPVRSAVFEGEKAYLPNQAEAYLKRLYGDNFMDIPPVEKREMHAYVEYKCTHVASGNSTVRTADALTELADGLIKFSVIVPVYNTEAYLPKCIESIIAQTYENMEIILVNDGSTDSCLAIMQRYAGQDNRIIVVSQENGGLSAARNAGLKIATGDYVAFVDSDDWVEPDMFEVLADHLSIKRPDFTCFRMQYDNEALHASHVYGKPFAIREFHDTEQILTDTLRIDNILTSAWSKVYNRNFLNEHGLRFEPGIVNEDTLFSFQVACHAHEVTFVDRIFYHAIEREGSITRSSYDIRIRDMDSVFEKGRIYLAKHELLGRVKPLYEARYLRSMLYIILQATRFLSFPDYKKAVKVLREETCYKTNNTLKNRRSLPWIYRILLVLSYNGSLFYVLAKTADIFGWKVH